MITNPWMACAQVQMSSFYPTIANTSGEWMRCGVREIINQQYKVVEETNIELRVLLSARQSEDSAFVL